MSRRQLARRLERRRVHARRRDQRAALPLAVGVKVDGAWPIVDDTGRVVLAWPTREAARAFVRARNQKAVA